MHIDFWKQRWADQQIGFHLDQVNPNLAQYWSEIAVENGQQVLVPLCGKSLDMVWLAAQGCQVMGVECSEQALQQFIDEQQLTATSSQQGEFTLHQAEDIQLLQGDFFKLNAGLLQSVTAVYDRASLIALPAEMRTRYVELLQRILPQSVSILLVTLDYEQQLMQGPPFAVSHNEVERLYQPSFDISLLDERNVIDDSPRFRESGLSQMFERVYKITR
ncbi:MAG TPA: thiopurine S-methyltransferase [Gammaproteobacteria bacterium]